MVYSGKPSTGCYLCRRRKIKCDETSPTCRNCSIYGKPCPGYRPDAIFRNETEKIQRLVEKSASSSSYSSISPTDRLDLSVISDCSQTVFGSNRAGKVDNASGTVDDDALLSLYRVADSTWEERAVCYFFDQYTTFGESGDCTNQLQYVPLLYAECCRSERSSLPSLCLRQAVDATALITLGNEANVPALTVKARRTYGMALRELRNIIQSPTQAVRDETFAAVVLLALFEDITGERNGLSSSHTVGIELLMKLRGENQLGHRLGRDLFSYAYAHTHIEILALIHKPRFNTEWITTLLDSDDPVHRLIVTSSKVSELFLKASLASPGLAAEHPATITSLIGACKVLDLELAQWSHWLPTCWLPLFVSSQQGESLIAYKRVPMAAIWNYYRAVRIVLQRLILDLSLALTPIISTDGRTDGPYQDDSVPESVIKEMITDVCRTIPFSLGDVDSLGNPIRSLKGKPQIRAFQGYTLVWPLWYILSCGLATPAQDRLIRSVLSRVGKELGIKLALILADAQVVRFHDARNRAPLSCNRKIP